MAAENAMDSLAASKQHTVLAHGLDEILAAGGLKATVGTDHGADQLLVGSNQADHSPTKNSAGNSD